MTNADAPGTRQFSRRTRIIGTLFLTGIVLVAVECSAQLLCRWREGYWRFLQSGRTAALFQAHPYLVASPRPGARATHKGVTIRHNQQGFRGAELGRKRDGVTRGLLLGGSSTYGTGVSNGETWPDFLAAELGAEFEIVNLGVPGYSTAENLIEAALWASDLQPDVMVFYEGWNDARNSFVEGLAPDYSDFHGRMQYFDLGQDVLRFGNRLASLYYANRIVAKLLRYDPHVRPHPAGTTDKLTAQPDPRALALYRRNLGLLAVVSREIGAEPVFVPQLLNAYQLHSQTPYGWLPFVRDVDLVKVVGHYNDVMREVATSKHVEFAGEVLTTQMRKEDFLDQGHFSPAGGRTFAVPVAQVLRRIAKRRL
jgi:lysophospholipase L1-like esterase